MKVKVSQSCPTLSLGFSRQEYWSELPCPPPEDLPNPGIKPGSPELQADSLPSKPTGKPISPSCMLCHSVMSDSLQLHGLQPTRLLCPQDSPGKKTGAGCHALLQRIFPTQGSNLWLLCLLHCRHILYPLSHLKVKVKSLSRVRLFATPWAVTY